MRPDQLRRAKAEGRIISMAKRGHIKRGLAARDGMNCRYCGVVFTSLAQATIDHVIPWSVLPTWALEALVLSCYWCNVDKADTPADEFVPVPRPGAVVLYDPRVLTAA